MTAEVTAVIMAGGMGLRMAASHPDLPKPLVTVGGRSLLETVIRQMLTLGAEEIRISLRHRAEEIRAHVRGLEDLPHAAITYMVEEEPLGTIGGLHDLRGTERTLLVTNGDLFSNVDLLTMLRMHRDRYSDVTIATHDEHHRLKLGEVLTDFEGNVLAYHEKPTKVFRVSSGIYLIEPIVLDLLGDREHLGFPALAERVIDSDMTIHEYFHESQWIDVNDAADLERARSMLAEDPTAFGFEPSSAEE